MKKRRRRICLTNAEKAVMWDRWKQGDSTHAIARLLDTSHTSIRRNLAPSGGIRPLQRKRSRLALEWPKTLIQPGRSCRLKHWALAITRSKRLGH